MLPYHRKNWMLPHHLHMIEIYSLTGTLQNEQATTHIIAQHETRI